MKNTIEPLYSLAVAAQLIPTTTVHALYVFLSRHKAEFPPRYKRVGLHEVRMLTQSEILRIREMTLLTTNSRYQRRARGERVYSWYDAWKEAFRERPATA